MFDRFFASEAGAETDIAAAAGSRLPDPTGETATVRRIVAKLEAMPPEQARLIASAAYTLARAANADLDISDEETAAIERELQARRVARRGDRRPRDRDGQAPGEDRRRNRGLRRDPRVQGAGDRGAAAGHDPGLLRGRWPPTARSRPRRRRSSTRSPRSSTSTTRRSTASAPTSTSSSRRSRPGPPDQPAAPSHAATRAVRPRRRSTRPSPSRRLTSASSSAS